MKAKIRGGGITSSGHCDDLEDIVAWAKTQPFFVEPFALAGQSLGAISVVRYAGKFPEDVDLLLTCAFPYIDGKEKMKEDFVVQEIIKKGYFDKVSKSTGRTLRIKTDFVEDLKRLNLMLEINNITAKTFVIVGSKDSESHIENSKKLFELLNCEKEFIMLDGIPHDLANTERDKILFTETIEKILKK